MRKLDPNMKKVINKKIQGLLSGEFNSFTVVDEETHETYVSGKIFPNRDGIVKLYIQNKLFTEPEK